MTAIARSRNECRRAGYAPVNYAAAVSQGSRTVARHHRAPRARQLRVKGGDPIGDRDADRVYHGLGCQSTPDAWLRLRLLRYSIRIWERDRRRHRHEEQLRPILPLVLYQGRRRWGHGREFSELFPQQVRHWPWVPHYAHLLIDQTRARPDQVRGELRGRIAQLAMMATFRKNWPLLQRLVPLLAELARVGAAEDWEEIVVYIAATTTREPQRWHRFADAVRRRVPGGGELMNKTERMLQIYADVREQESRRQGRRVGRKEGRRQGRREGRKEGELRGKVLTIEALLGRDVPWTTIQAATGIDQATFHRLKHRLKADGGSSPRPN